MQLTITGIAVTEALRSAHARKDIEAMRKICGDVADETLAKIGTGDLEIRGDSETEFAIYTIDRRYLWPTPMTGDRRGRDRIEVTGRSERHIERTEMGVLLQMDRDGWWLDDVSVPGVRVRVADAKYTVSMVRESRAMFPNVSIRDIRAALADTGSVDLVSDWLRRHGWSDDHRHGLIKLFAATS